VNTSKRPACPRCARPKLERRVSRFAISKGRKETAPGEDDLPDVDEARMEGVMAELEREADGLDEDNPQQMARLMRKLYDGAGLPRDARMEEAIRRLEAGESPERIEEEMGDLFEGEDPLLGETGGGTLRGLARKLKPPEVDETLYDL
jgi:hypothetical protein